MNSCGFGQKVVKQLQRNVTATPLHLTGMFNVEHWRRGRLLRKLLVPNGITDAGINNIFDVHFGAGTQLTTWYIGLIDASGYTAVAAGDTMASHAGWTEFTTYSEATRPAWGVGAAAGKAITNATPEDFNITGAATLKGIFSTSNNTKGGSSGTLWATALFASDLAVVATDVLKITYTVNGT